jgi:hypothetical protein
VTGVPEHLPPQLPPRDPHPFAVHVGVDSAVAFLATLFLGLMFSVSMGVIIAAALVIGICLAPYTRRVEVRQLAARATDERIEPGADDAGADPE